MKEGGLSNGEMISGLNAGDETVFAYIYNTFHQAVYANICKLVRNENQSEDLLQEVFLLLWNKRSLISRKQDVGGWLFTTSYYTSLAHVRKLVKNKIVAFNGELLDITDADPAIDTEAEYLEKVAKMNMAIATLPPQKKSAFTLCKIEGKSYEEAARELGVSAETVKGYIKASLKIVRDQVASQPEIAAPLGASLLTILFLT